MAVMVLTKENFDEVVADGKCIIDFWASWCGPCRMQLPILDKFAEANADVKVCKVNVDEQPELAQKFGVMSIPTIVSYVDGAMKNKAVGVQREPELAAML